MVDILLRDCVADWKPNSTTELFLKPHIVLRRDYEINAWSVVRVNVQRGRRLLEPILRLRLNCKVLEEFALYNSSPQEHHDWKRIHQMKFA